MIKHWIFALGFFGICLLGTPPQASAFDVFDRPCANANEPSAVCKDSSGSDPDPISGANGVLLRIVDIIAFVAGVVAIIMIIVGAIYYITSNGDANNIKSARTTILNALIGIAVIVLARTLIVFVIKKL